MVKLISAIMLCSSSPGMHSCLHPAQKNSFNQAAFCQELPRCPAMGPEHSTLIQLPPASLEIPLVFAVFVLPLPVPLRPLHFCLQPCLSGLAFPPQGIEFRRRTHADQKPYSIPFPSTERSLSVGRHICQAHP